MNKPPRTTKAERRNAKYRLLRIRRCRRLSGVPSRFFPRYGVAETAREAREFDEDARDWNNGWRKV